MKRNSITHTALLAMLAIAIFVGCHQSDTKEDQQLQQQPVVLEQSNVEQPIVADTTDLSTENIVFADIPGDVKIDIHRGKSMLLEMNGVSLSAPDSAIVREGTYTVSALTKEELPPLTDEMVNVTLGSGNGYRFLPNGEHFSPYAELRMAYDESKLPHGYTPDDIYTSYYDEEKKTWVRLFRKEVDTINREIVSLTTHFTDFINEILKAPEMPETEAFVPTMISDLEAANPLEGITLIQPPTANNMGTANLNYPLQIPAGRGGMQPNLALTYNSSGGNGWLGIGWDISIPCISVETRWGVPLYDSKKETETYLLNGEQLLVHYDSLPTFARKHEDRLPDGTRFYSRIEGSFDSIIRHGTSPKNYWWEVVDRNGTHYYYGNNKRNAKTYELKTADGNIGKWYLSKVIDRNGNTTLYSYKYYDNNSSDGKMSGRALYPDTILYTLPERVDILTHWYGHSVTFSYKTGRPDPVINGNLGVKENYCHLLDEIKINYVKCEPQLVVNGLPFDTVQAIYDLFPTNYPKTSLFGGFSCVYSIYEKWYSLPETKRGSDEEWMEQILNCLNTNSDWITDHPNLWQKISSDYIDTSYYMYKQEDKMVRGYKFLYDTSLYTHKSRLMAVVEMSPSEWASKLPTLTLSTLNNNDTNKLKYHKFSYNEFENNLAFANDALEITHDFGENIFDRSMLGTGKSTNYSINAGVGAGLGKDVAKQTLNINANGNIGISSKNEGETAMVDINGDGYPDLLYKDECSDGVCLKAMLYDRSSNGYVNEYTIVLTGNNFQVSKTRKSYSVGADLNAGIELSDYEASVGLNVGYQFSSSQSMNTVYYTDADANGLIDILVNGKVYFNMGILNDTILFDDNPSIATEQLQSCTNNYFTLEESADINSDLFREGNMMITTVYTADTSKLGQNQLITSQDTSYLQASDPDTIRRNVVRVWVAPKTGSITISGTAALDPTFDMARRLSDNDGVRLTIQHNNSVKKVAKIDINATSANMSITTAFNVKKGDRIYFRVEALKNNSYDIVNWSPAIKYANISSPETDYEGRKIYQYDSQNDFFAWNREGFVMPASGYITIDSRYSVTSSFSHPINLLAKIVDTNNATVTTIFNTYIPAGKKTSGGTIGRYTLTEGHRVVFEARCEYEVDWRKLSWNPSIRSLDDIGNIPAYTIMPETNDTVYTIDLRPSPTYTTFVTHTLTENVTPSTNDNIKFVTTDNLLIGRNITLVRRSSTGAINLYNGIINGTSVSIPLNNQPAGFYEMYISGTMPEDIASTKAYFISNGKEIGIKFDEVFDITDTITNVPSMKAFGNMNHQWGQFGYNTDVIGQPIVERTIRVNELDPNRVNVVQNMNVDSISLDSIDMLVSSVPNQDETAVGQMSITFDTSTMQRIWTGFAYRTYLTPSQMSASNWQMLKTMVVDSTVYETVSNTHLNSVVGAKVGPIRESSQTAHNYSASASLSVPFAGSANACFNYSHGENRQLQDYMDMNGDGYPDIVVENGVQYTNSRGGLSSVTAGNAPDNVQGIQVSKYNSFSSQGGGAFTEYTKYISQKANVKIAQKKSDDSGDIRDIETTSSENFDFGGNGCLSWSFDNYEVSFTDMNGDGLPDKVYGDIVYMNLGYGYYQGTTLSNNPLTENSSFNYVLGSSASYTTTLPGVDNTISTTVNRSFSAGMGVSYSNNNSKTIYSDVNGDGLVDKIEGKQKVYFNTGWGFSDSPMIIDTTYVSITSGSRTLNFDINGRLTMGVPLFGFKVQGSGGVNKSTSQTSTETALMDMNADGLPDIVKRDGNNIIIYRNNMYATDKLAEVTSFYGNKIEIAYDQAPYSDYSRQRPTVMSAVSVWDAVAGDVNSGKVTNQEITYKNYHHNIGERTAYGFDTVITTINAYRKIIDVYHNDNYKLRGVKRYEGTFSCGTQSKCYLDKQMFYKMKEIATGTIAPDGMAHCYGATFPALDSVVVRHYDNSGVIKLTTAEKFGHGSYGRNNIVINYNDISTTKDDVKVLLQYYQNVGNNQTALVKQHEVKTGNTLLRKKTATYDSRGNTASISVYDGSSSYTTNYEYDHYGNIIKVRHPSNMSNGSRLTYEYSYDTLLFKHIVKVSDLTFGTSSRADYNVEIGKPMTVYSISGDSISYNYDDWGRLLAIRAPNEADTLLRPTVQYVRWDNAPEARPSIQPNFCGATGGRKPQLSSQHIYSVVIPQQTVKRLWVQTYHHSALDTAQKIITYIFTDGMGRVAQTRKTAEINGVRKQVSSGRVEYDALGRTIRTYDPFVVNDNTNGYVVPQASGTYTATTYDILDRKLSDTVRHGNQKDITKYEYSFETKNGFKTIKTKITDAKGNINIIYNDSRELKQVVTDGNGFSTTFTYDALGQLTKSIDPEGFTTSYTYNMRGLPTQRKHPDAGTTTYKYDALGQLTQETNNVGEKITYKYNHNRLASKNYSSLSNNNVTYTYGTPSDTNKASIGRITYISDGSGYQRLYYDKMGNVMKNIRTFALPNDNKSYTFEMHFKYDSWGRMKEMIYPDGEKLTYSYNDGGELRNVKGIKGSHTYKYIDSIYYNEYGGRSTVWYGNGTKNLYGYDNLHRMTSLQSYAKVNNTMTMMQNITYTYDKVSNITNVSNTAGTINSLGKTSSMVYGYDNGNRLLSATMTYGSNTTVYNVSYTPSGRMATKYHGATTALQSKNAHFGYCSADRPHTVRRIFDVVNKTYVLHDIQWDMKGNLLTHAMYNYGDPTYAKTERHLYWTEDNRLHTAVDNIYYSYYVYDHTGERTLKLTGKNSFVDVNGETQATATLENATLYVGPYLVATNQGYTKHYYNGTERICAKLGNGGLGNDLLSNPSHSAVANVLFTQCQTAMKEQSAKEEDQMCISSVSGEWNPEMRLEGYKDKFSPVQPNLQPQTSINVSTFRNTLSSYSSAASASENNIYFYHGDHLGSASWITNKTGTPVQHLQYMPYGEPLVNEKTTSYEERFTFTGKERDSETGYSYFGARYYDSDLMTGWLSVDPMADKYPNISPYAYCANNPVKLVDPDGRDVEIIKNDENKTVTIKANFYYNKKEMGDYGDAFVNGFKNSLNSWEKDIKLALNDYNVEFDFNMIETNSPKVDATNDAIGNAIIRNESLNGTGTTSQVVNNKYLDVYPDKHSKAKYTDLEYQDNLYYSYEGCEGTIKHEIGHLFGLYDRYVDNNGKQPGGTPINGDIMNLPGKRNPNSGVGAFLRIWNSMGLNQPGNKTVIINQGNKEKL